MGTRNKKLVGKTVLSVTHPDDRETSSKAIRQAAHSGPRIQRLEKRYLHKSGGVVWGEVSSNLIFDVDGKPDYFVTQVLDITERKKAEKALQRQTEELTTINSLGRVVNANLSVDQVGKAVIEAIVAAVRPDLAMLFRRKGDRLVLHNYGPKEFAFCPDELPMHRVGECLCGLAVRDGQPVYSTDIGRDSRCTWEECKKAGLRSFVALPLRSGEEIIGLLGLGSAVERDFQKQSSFLETLASEIALCFQNALLYEQVEVHAAELEQRVKQRTADLEKANEQLRIFRKFAEASGQAFAMANFDHQVTYANPAMLRLCGEEKLEDVLGKNFLVYYPGELRERLEEQMLSGIEQEGQWAGELMFVTTAGEPRTVLTDAFQIRNDTGDPLYVAVVMTDITELKKAQEALAASEMKYRQLVETTGTGYVILDDHGGIVDANAEYLRISGHRTLEEVLGRTVMEWTAPYDVDRNANEVEKCYRQGFVRQLEIDYVHADGEIIPIDINATCLNTEDGRQIVCLCRDITERREVQKALERERQSLWRMLQASDHERRIISYEIHDGLAQYLASAIMQLQTHDALKENAPHKAKKAYRTALELVRQAHAESRRLISEVRPPIIDEDGLETAISHLVHEQRRRGGSKIEYHSEVQFSRLPPILENALYRIVNEALTNACKHSKSEKVTVSMIQEGQDVRLEVRDWGIGFNAESVAEGHFGLEGIRQRVRLLGGRLTIETALGSGTLVQVVVPILERRNDG